MKINVQINTTRLSLLKDATNEILENLKNDLEAVAIVSDDAINWGDLSCVSAEEFFNETGKGRFRVWIEEVEPGADMLQKYVREKLAQQGWENVYVRTEW